MTSIVRYKNLIVADNIYVDIIGSEIVKSRSDLKLYTHPIFPVVCALSGPVSATMFNLVNKHLTNYIANLHEYPEKDITPLDLQEEFDELELTKSDPSGFELAVYNKKQTLFVHFSKAKHKFSIQIHPARKLLILGTGSDVATKFQALTDRNPEMTATEFAEVCSRTDTYTGAELFVLDLSTLSE